MQLLLGLPVPTACGFAFNQEVSNILHDVLNMYNGFLHTNCIYYVFLERVRTALFKDLSGKHLRCRILNQVKLRYWIPNHDQVKYQDSYDAECISN